MTIFSLLLQGVAATFKALLLLPKRKQLKDLLSLCSNLWKSINSEEEAQVAKHYARRGVKFTYFFSLLVFTALINVLVQPMLDKFVVNLNGTIISSRVLPYPTGLIHENLKIYSIWYVLQIPAGMFIVIMIVGIDTAVVVFVLHACAYFRVLQYRLVKFKELCEKEQKKNQKKESKKKIFQEIVTIVQFHQNILQFSATVEHIVNPVILLQTILSIAAICIFGINSLLRDEDILHQVLHIGGSILQLFMFCWPPSNLQTESFEISTKVYELPWYDWPKKEQKLLELMIFRSQKFVVLSAGKFTFMSLRTFTSILSSAYSFFTLLRRIL
ncbi:odorant receptor 13a-like [Leptopilina heterotoma]|uniref:odorant receptor 13a-like n=1 Tax=Leptopilina heterotoma TaxID=63436 RepID=UPI001CA98F39|nr:odorant receptor 13a-like [Leptopilina heterotoma]